MKAGSIAHIFTWSLIVIGLTPAIASAGERITPRYSAGQITPTDWREYLAEVEAIPDIKCHHYATNQYVCESASRRTIWIFTRIGHPAHPAVSRGILFLRQATGGVRLGIDRSGHYAADQVAFDKWMKELVELDLIQVAEWGKEENMR